MELENLKSLNSMLLNETVQLPHQVNSTVLSEVSLESALTLSKMENKELQAELTCLNDRTEQLHLEKDLVLEFVAVQVSQQAEIVKKEIDGLWRERVEVETRLENLEIEKDLVKEELDEALKELDQQKQKTEELSRIKIEIDEVKVRIEESVQLYIAELEAIKNAFQNKVFELEDQNRRLKLLQNLVGEAPKGKNFFTMFPSATAILAAAVACVAYVAQP